MENIRIIAHRGMRGPFIENSLESFAAAAKLNVVAVEFDVQATKDGRLAVLHSMGSPKKVYGITAPINTLSWNELRQYKNKDGQPIPSFEEVMEVLGNKQVMIDVKDRASAGILIKRLKTVPAERIFLIGSLLTEAMADVKKAFPDLNIAIQAYKHPLKSIKLAKKMGLSHIGLVLYLVNPFTYAAARRAGLKVGTYQNYVSILLTWRWFVRLISWLYPGIIIISDRPDKVAPALPKK